MTRTRSRLTYSMRRMGDEVLDEGAPALGLKRLSERGLLIFMRNMRRNSNVASSGSVQMLFVKALTDDLRADDRQRSLPSASKVRRLDARQGCQTQCLIRTRRRRRIADEKVLVFTQFADTVRLPGEETSTSRCLRAAPRVTGESSMTQLVSPGDSAQSAIARGTRFQPEDELRVLVATDVLSEGQNLQDCFVVVNYDLALGDHPAHSTGRPRRPNRPALREVSTVTRSCQRMGSNDIIRLRARVRQRLQENAEVVGADEAFFEDDGNDRKVLDLY